MTGKMQKLLIILRALQKIDPEFPLQYAICLAEISLNEGMSLTHLSQKTDMPLSTVSRIVGALSSHRQRGTPYGLVEVTVSPKERRKKELYLSKKGQFFIHNIEETLPKNTSDTLHV